VLDGNVFRVLSRFFGDATPIDSTEGKKTFGKLAQQILEENPALPSRHNQAMMDFGATHCTPQKPKCSDCPLQPQCRAYLESKVNSLPVKQKKIKKSRRFFNYLVVKQADKVLIEKRVQQDIWKGLYQFPLIETEAPPKGEEAVRTSALWKKIFGDSPVKIDQLAGPFRQTLTHQYIQATFWEIHLSDAQLLNSDGFLQEEQKNLSKFAFPKIIDCYLQDKSLYLKLL
jgi:A/G-specific adenine glycosylase